MLNLTHDFSDQVRAECSFDFYSQENTQKYQSKFNKTQANATEKHNKSPQYHIKIQKSQFRQLIVWVCF